MIEFKENSMKTIRPTNVVIISMSTRYVSTATKENIEKTQLVKHPDKRFDQWLQRKFLRI